MNQPEPDPPETPAPRQREPLWHGVVIGIAEACIWAVGAMPAWLAYAIGDVLAVPWYLYWRLNDFAGRRSKGYWRNTRIAFRPGSMLGAERPKRHLWLWSRHIAWLAIDFCRMRNIHAGNFRQYVNLDDYAPLQDLFAEGNGLIFATGHMGVWDVAGHAAGLLGLPITSVFRPSPIPALNRLIARMRTTTGQTVVARKNVMRTLKEALARKTTVGLLCDGGGKHSSVVAPFLGTVARSVATPALLHLVSGAPIAVVAARRTGKMRYRIRLYDVIRDANTGDRHKDLVAITTRVNDGLSRAIAESPEQWFWQSRRFRHRPPGEVPGPDGLPPLATPAAPRQS